MKHSIFVLFLFGYCLAFTQEETPPVFDSLVQAHKLDSLQSKYGFEKTVPERYKLSFYTALSHYPALDSTTITFKEARIKTTLNARPTMGSLLFRKRDKRAYVIRVNAQDKDSLILLTEVPFNSQIGLFGHELAHFSDYHTRSFGQVLGRLFAYSSLKGKTKYEKEIDSMTVQVGLGWQLYAWSYYVLFESNGSVAYKAYKRTVYLKPEEIAAMLEGLK